MKITIQNLTDTEINQMGVTNWPVWQKEISSFDWYYDEQEQFYVIEGRIIIKTDELIYEINPGAFVTCPKGLKCHWKVISPVKKYYKFIE
jgi:uncharacterized protein